LGRIVRGRMFLLSRLLMVVRMEGWEEDLAGLGQAGMGVGVDLGEGMEEEDMDTVLMRREGDRTRIPMRGILGRSSRMRGLMEVDMGAVMDCRC